jgi:hypothetical protein
MDELRTAKRKDVSPKEGEKKYGNVTYADEKNKKYPIDTEEHIRAAYNYISKAKNAGKYSAADAASIKRKIIAAWKSKISKDGPPSAAGRSAFFSDDVADIVSVPDSQVEEIWNSMRSEMERTDLELAQEAGIPNIRAITDAPKLRAKDARYCANCKFFQYLPAPTQSAYTSSGETVYAYPMRGVCTQPDIQAEVDGGWVCDKWEEFSPDDAAEEMDEARAAELEPVTIDNSDASRAVAPIKMIGETRFAGYGILFSKDKR